MTLRALREQRSLTQEQLAALTGLDQTTISQLERGIVRDPRSSTVKLLARALDVLPREIDDCVRQSVIEAA